MNVLAFYIAHSHQSIGAKSKDIFSELEKKLFTYGKNCNGK